MTTKLFRSFAALLVLSLAAYGEYVKGFSKASVDRFCSNCSAVKGFLPYRKAGCEVNTRLADVYPRCPMKSPQKDTPALGRDCVVSLVETGKHVRGERGRPNFAEPD